MNFKDGRKAVFLPVSERTLCQYKGYVLNGEMRNDLKEKEVYTIKKEYSNFEPKTILSKIIAIIIIFPFIPFVVIGAAIDVFNNNEKCLTFLQNIIVFLFANIFRKGVKISHNKYAKEPYKEVVEEDIPFFLNHCHNYFAKVYLYSYTELNEEDTKRVNNLIESGIVQGITIIDKITDLTTLIEEENISIHNSFIVLLSDDLTELNEAKKLGFNDKLFSRNIELWGKRAHTEEYSLRWNSKETLASMKEYVNHYIHAKKNVYFNNHTVIYIEDHKDIFLNAYISKNYNSLCSRFKEKKMEFIYFPALKNGLSELPDDIFSFLQFRIPILYNLRKDEIKEIVTGLFATIDEESFYSSIINPLELPYFKRPCLLRSLSGGFAYTANKFTYKPLVYDSEEDLNNLFDQYFKQLVIPDDEEGVRYKRESPPQEYDTDYYFYRDAFKNEPELKEKIDQLKAQGNYGVLAEAIIYMMTTIKNVQPALGQKIQHLIEAKDLTQKSEILSTIRIDKNNRIFLPEFGNKEIKLHALPKTVYLLFLKNPEGIRFKEIYMYKEELMEIYADISPKSDIESMKKSIDDLIDCTNPSLNQKCSRIRQEIQSIIDEPLAKYYYIDGTRGEEKKIKIDRSYIHFE